MRRSLRARKRATSDGDRARDSDDDDDDDDERLEYPRSNEFTRLVSVPLLAYVDASGDDELVRLADNDVRRYAALVVRDAIEFRRVPRADERVYAQAPESTMPLYYRKPATVAAFPWTVGDTFLLFEDASRDPVAYVRLVDVQSQTPATGRVYVRLGDVFSQYAAWLLRADV